MFGASNRVDRLMLHEFIAANRAAIVERARSKVAARPIPLATEVELANGIPMFLDQLIGILQKSEVQAGSSAALGESAAEHARTLMNQGFSVAQVVYDYGGVCQAVTELAGELDAPITVAEFHKFNGCLDDAIAGAVTEYSRQREQSITDEGHIRSGELAHELRNALGSALLAFETISTGNVGPRGSTAALLGRSLRRLGDLIDSSVARVRIDAGIRSPERISLRDFMEETEVGASLEANLRGVSLIVNPVPLGVDVQADRQLLSAALGNLLQNAFKFTRPRGLVTLQVIATLERVKIEVADECGGIAPDKMSMLFRRFAQQNEDRRGLGLGLTIAREIVEAENGQILVRDLAPIGCVFTIDLPRIALLA